MTKREIYENLKKGYTYGYYARWGFQKSIYTAGKYIFFEYYGRWASRMNYKDFCRNFSVGWKNANEFMKKNRLYI